VIETRRPGFTLPAHAIEHHGTADSGYTVEGLVVEAAVELQLLREK